MKPQKIARAEDRVGKLICTACRETCPQRAPHALSPTQQDGARIETIVACIVPHGKLLRFMNLHALREMLLDAKDGRALPRQICHGTIERKRLARLTGRNGRRTAVFQPAIALRAPQRQELRGSARRQNDKKEPDHPRASVGTETCTRSDAKISEASAEWTLVR